MKRLIFIAMMLAAFSIMAEEKPLPPVPLHAVTADFTQGEMNTLLEILGLEVNRFDFEVPYSPRFDLILKKYIKGKLIETVDCGGDIQSSGKQRLLLIRKDLPNGSTFAFRLIKPADQMAYGISSGNSQCICENQNGLAAKAWGAWDVDSITPGKEIPVYFIGQNPDHAGGDAADTTVEQYIQRYDSVCLLYLKLSSGQSDTSKFGISITGSDKKH